MARAWLQRPRSNCHLQESERAESIVSVQKCDEPFDPEIQQMGNTSKLYGCRLACVSSIGTSPGGQQLMSTIKEYHIHLVSWSWLLSPEEVLVLSWLAGACLSQRTRSQLLSQIRQEQ